MTGLVRLTLIENAYNFLNESIRNSQRAEDEGHLHWTFAIVNAAQAIELLLKERLRREHAILVFSNIDKPGSQTVSLDKAIERLQACEVDLDLEDMKRLRAAKEVRNHVVHYEVSVPTSQMENAFVNLFEFAHGFHLRELGEELHPYLDPNLWEAEAALMEKFRSQSVTYQGAELAKTTPLEILNSQSTRYYKVEDQFFERIPWGAETWHKEDGIQNNCHDCGVLPNQLHAPDCDNEQCPRCHGQALICDCDLEERWEPYPTLMDRIRKSKSQENPASSSFHSKGIPPSTPIDTQSEN